MDTLHKNTERSHMRVSNREMRELLRHTDHHHVSGRLRTALRSLRSWLNNAKRMARPWNVPRR